MSNVGLINPEANPDDHEDYYCPCTSGVPSCPANFTEAELYRYRSVTYDEFYDLSGADPAAWILHTYDSSKDIMFVSLIFSTHHTQCGFLLLLNLQDWRF